MNHKKALINIFIFFNIFSNANAYAMCEYPHNPPILCIKAKIIKSKKISIKNLRCLYTVKNIKLIRPAKTYRYNNKLDLIRFNSNQKIKSKKIIEIYSKDKKCLTTGKIISKLIVYNCSDFYQQISDYSFINYGKLADKVRDPWTEKVQFFDCQKILRKKE